MSGWMVVCRKELSDHLGNRRFLLICGLILALALLSAYQGAQYIRTNDNASFINIFSGSSGGTPFTQLMFYFGPVLGLALSFDAINRERSQGSLSVLLSQPLFRDSIINGKFLAGVGALSLVSVATVGIMSGVAIPMLGFGPTPDEIVRIIAFTLLTVLYLSVWFAIGTFFSTVTKKTTTSMLMSLSTWVFSILVISIIASLIANSIVSTRTPTGSFVNLSGETDLDAMNAAISEWQERSARNREISSFIRRISPSTLYSEAASTLLTVNNVISSSSSGPVVVSYDGYGSIGAEQDMLATWPQITVLAAIMAACFAASYTMFLRQEIRAGA
jgi:ABC-2 type transport system permease protein